MKRNPECQRCSLHTSTKTRCIWGSGNRKAKLFFVGEAPGAIEDQMGLCFVGPAGELLDHIVDKLGLSWDDIFKTNCFKCRPPDNELPKKKELLECWKHCQKYFNQELKIVDPPVVVALGGTALSLLTGKNLISKWEGSKVWQAAKNLPSERNYSIYASYHPAAVLRRPNLEKNIATAIYVAAKAAGLKPKPKGIETGFYPYEIRS